VGRCDRLPSRPWASCWPPAAQSTCAASAAACVRPS